MKRNVRSLRSEGSQQSTLRLSDDVHPGETGIGALTAEPGDRSVDHIVTYGLYGLIVDTVTYRCSGAQIRQYDISLGHERREYLPASWLGEIEGQTFLPSILDEELPALPRRNRMGPSCRSSRAQGD